MVVLYSDSYYYLDNNDYADLVSPGRSRQFDTEYQAEKEAEKLAKKYPGKRFAVYEGTCVFYSSPNLVEKVLFT